VQPGESLAGIAVQYQTTWKRLFDKNSNIVDPDAIHPNDHLVIPTAEEQLTERDVPVRQPVKSSSPAVALASAKQSSTKYAGGSSAGNSYISGYCTWYAKNRRPDMPNNLGNAITWVSRAAAQGMATGSAPRAGAIGQQGNHVVYVESVNGDGTVTVSEMNHVGFNIISSRTVSAGTFSYIY
jgi:surface antigen